MEGAGFGEAEAEVPKVTTESPKERTDIPKAEDIPEDPKAAKRLKVEAAHRTADARLQEARQQLRELEAQLDNRLQGHLAALAMLGGECITRGIEKFDYKICLFR